MNQRTMDQRSRRALDKRWRYAVSPVEPEESVEEEVKKSKSNPKLNEARLKNKKKQEEKETEEINVEVEKKDGDNSI